MTEGKFVMTVTAPTYQSTFDSGEFISYYTEFRQFILNVRLVVE